MEAMTTAVALVALAVALGALVVAVQAARSSR